MKALPTFVAILLLLGVTGGGMYLLVKNMPEAAKEERKKVVVAVEVMEVKAEDVELTLYSQGLVNPVVETVATSEVAGLVSKVAPNFKAGGEFKKGDVLLEVDGTDWLAALAKAEAEESVAKLELEMERSRKEQAERDWKELGGSREQSELARREPQMEAAEARLAAATKAVEKAAKDVARTKLVALYDGRVRSVATDIGSYASPGMRLAELYGTEGYEVRLPVSLNDFAFVEVNAPGEVVTLRTRVAGKVQEWKAKILRTEGQIDRASRSVYLVAGLEGGKDGFTREDVMAPNLFVEAEVKGRTLPGVVRIPRKAFVDTDRVLVVDAEQRLRFRKVEVVHESPQEMYVSAGLDEGEKVCVTALAAVVEGMEVRVLGDEGKEKEQELPAGEGGVGGEP